MSTEKVLKSKYQFFRLKVSINSSLSRSSLAVSRPSRNNGDLFFASLLRLISAPRWRSTVVAIVRVMRLFATAYKHCWFNIFVDDDGWLWCQSHETSWTTTYLICDLDLQILAPCIIHRTQYEMKLRGVYTYCNVLCHTPVSLYCVVMYWLQTLSFLRGPMIISLIAILDALDAKQSNTAY